MPRIRLLWWLKFDSLERPAASLHPVQCKIQKMKQLLWTANPILVVWVLLVVLVPFILVHLGGWEEFLAIRRLVDVVDRGVVSRHLTIGIWHVLRSFKSSY